MADTTIAGIGTKTAPLDYKIPKSIELLPRSIKATFDGSGAGASFLPTLQVIADSGDVVGSYPVDTALAAGASADVTWFPGVTRGASAASASSIVGVCVQLTANQVPPLPPNTYDIPWDAIVYDTSGGTMWSAIQPNLLFAPTSGLYIATMGLDLNGNPNQLYNAILKTTSAPLGIALGWGPFAAASNPLFAVTHVTYMNATDTCTWRIYAGTGGIFSINHGTQFGTFATLTRLD